MARLREDLDRVLNVVLNEVEAHTSGVEQRLTDLSELVEGQSISAEGSRRTVASFDQAVADVRRLINKRIDVLEASVADLAARPVPQRDAVLDDRFGLLARTIEGHLEASGVDLGPVEAQLERLSRVVEAGLASCAETVSAQARDIEQLREMISWMQERLLVDVHFSSLERDTTEPGPPRLHS